MIHVTLLLESWYYLGWIIVILVSIALPEDLTRLLKPPNNGARLMHLKHSFVPTSWQAPLASGTNKNVLMKSVSNIFPYLFT